MKPTIKIKLDKGATMPRYAHATDVGADVTALRTWLVQGDGTQHELQTIEDCIRMQEQRIDCAKVKIDTGVHVQPEAGYYVELVPNSRLAKLPFIYANSIGIIDPTYTGSIRAVLNTVNRLTPDDLAQFLPGRVVGQLIVRHRHEADFVQVDTLEATERGAGGFGSTEQMLPLDSWHPLPTESGQQSTLSPTDGQQTCLAPTAENATQPSLSCTDAHQSLFTSNGN